MQHPRPFPGGHTPTSRRLVREALERGAKSSRPLTDREFKMLSALKAAESFLEGCGEGGAAQTLAIVRAAIAAAEARS